MRDGALLLPGAVVVPLLVVLNWVVLASVQPVTEQTAVNSWFLNPQGVTNLLHVVDFPDEMMNGITSSV